MNKPDIIRAEIMASTDVKQRILHDEEMLKHIEATVAHRLLLWRIHTHE